MTSSKTIKIMLVDDELEMRRAWERLLQMQSDMEPVPGLDRADQLLAAIRTHHPDVVVLDLRMPGADPLAAAAAAAKAAPQTRIIVFSGMDDGVTIQRVMEAGAWGFLPKLEHPVDVLVAIRRVARGEKSFPAAVA